jgi:hypothetical protein
MPENFSYSGCRLGCRVSAIALLFALVFNINDLLYTPNASGLNFYYQVYSAPTASSHNYEIVKIICGLIRFSILSIFIYVLWGGVKSVALIQEKMNLTPNLFSDDSLRTKD